MAVIFTVTDAGRAALVNAKRNGTNAVLVATVGVTATAFAPGQALPSEIKRIATISGGATAADTIHVTIFDTTADSYTVRGYGLYLDDGTLFASYGQAAVIVEKSTGATMALSVDAQFKNIDATQITFGDTNFANPAATVDVLGVVKLADDATTTTGTDSVRAVTPKSLLAALNARLGIGAPSDFIKTLLTKPSVLAFCTALGIRGAAQYDTGSGNGLDADLLDNQHGSYYRAWANLTGVPGQFPPTLHSHLWSEISNPPETASRWPSWSEVTGKPVTFVPSAHTHAIGDVVGLQGSLDGKLPIAGGTMSGPLWHAIGAPSTQQVFEGYGWNNAVMRWKVVMETDGKYAIYAYAADGGSAEQALVMSSTSTGGRDLRFYGSTVWNAANFDPNSKAPVANPNFTGIVYVTVNNGSSAKARLFPYGTNGTAFESVTADSTAYAPMALTGSSVIITAANGGKVTVNGPVVQSGGWTGPGQGVGTMSYQASGSYGGGYAITDGQYNIGLYSVGGVLNIGFGTNGGALTSKFQFAPDGTLQAWANLTLTGGALRSQNWGGTGTDGVTYYGNANSYIYKQGGNYIFANEQGGYTAYLGTGGQIWTSSNITPLDRNVGGNMGAPIYFGGGGSGNGIYPGNGDNASFSANNLALKSWYGIGFGPSISGQPVAAGAYSHWFDVRTGNMGIAGNLNANGTLYANGGFQYSDREIKKNITARPVQRGIAIALARAYAEWDRKADGEHDQGHVAQELQSFAPQHVRHGPKRKTKPGLLVVDKPGAAMEGVCDNALHLEEHDALINEHSDLIGQLLKRIEQLENAA